MLWSPVLPAGWTLGTASGSGSPEIVAGEIVFSGLLAENPLSFSYTVTVPPGEAGPREVRGTVEYMLDAMANPETVQADPDPLQLNRLHTLEVSSLHGGADPPAGTNTYDFGTGLTCAVTNSPLADGVGTQHLCVGWSGTGSVPADNGTTNSGPFTITNDSTIVWNWQTQYELSASAGPGGSVTVSNGWYDAGTTGVVTAVFSNGYHFAGWSGDVPLSDTNANPVYLIMDQARTVTAQFSINSPDDSGTFIWLR